MKIPSLINLVNSQKFAEYSRENEKFSWEFPVNIHQPRETFSQEFSREFPGNILQIFTAKIYEYSQTPLGGNFLGIFVAKICEYSQIWPKIFTAKIDEDSQSIFRKNVCII